MNIFKRIKQFFCKHDFEKKRIIGYKIENGWLLTPYKNRCKKCGKTYISYERKHNPKYEYNLKTIRAEYCVVCGEFVPEGYMLCLDCEKGEGK